jgi:quercetin dioxygenase-like cupin family protein
MSNFYYDKDCNLQELIPGKNYRKIKAYNKNMMMVEVFFEDGAVGEPHTHVHDQMAYCLEGEFEFTIGDETKKIKQGDSVFMPSNILHGCKLLSPKGRLLDIFSPMREDFLK